MKSEAIAAVMIHVPDWKEGLAWYAKAFPHAKRVSLPEFDWVIHRGVQIDSDKIRVRGYIFNLDREHVPACTRKISGREKTIDFTEVY